ncbi:phage integrase central domain-containing protein [Inquilinus ginsengisoli]|uniref:phage integrase central domain-containing protein n=1 Tax=Inquilinus ginsengisoli TaxID=363840 RepID=UPI003D2518F5
MVPGIAHGRKYAPCDAPSMSAISLTFRNRLLTEITPDDLRMMCGKVKERGAPATAVHVRDIVKLIFAFAILHGEKVANPADEVGPASIATVNRHRIGPPCRLPIGTPLAGCPGSA